MSVLYLYESHVFNFGKSIFDTMMFDFKVLGLSFY